ncbi:hypothetical protein [Ancylomarina sp. 16SWW S1-10-2]|uniref:hypothetical protein n=1 Tax=Ancylomarina sp. 16SWW S1-10-2 TaxID=2499681 RepID=UPI0012AE7F8F|nr:hypothetical protein [Ancylomarina sp. 16SWW S1-10-2]MRT94172.1 hypothetical protein [Ancylomarina sp. 16SWW S1-10-2]
MKKYKFQSVDNISYALINIGIFTSPIVICPILVLLKVASNQLLSILLSFPVLILGLIFYKQLIQIKEQKTEIDDEGFGYLNQRKHSWDMVKWYRIDHNKARTI